MVIPVSTRRKRVVCHKCSELTNCVLNRRSKLRESQAGKVIMVTREGREIEVTLHDISQDGAGFDLPLGNPRTKNVSVNSRVFFKCSWNPRLLGHGTYQIMSIVGRRVGVKRV